MCVYIIIYIKHCEPDTMCMHISRGCRPQWVFTFYGQRRDVLKKECNERGANIGRYS